MGASNIICQEEINESINIAIGIEKSEYVEKNQKRCKFQFKKKILHEMNRMLISSISQMNLHHFKKIFKIHPRIYKMQLLQLKKPF